MELARQANVPESTTRRYVTRFESFLKYDERQRGRRFHPECVAVIMRIQSLYQDGIEAEEIERILAREFPINVEIVESTPSPPPSFATQNDVALIVEQLMVVREEVVATREENTRLREALVRIELEKEQREVARDKAISEINQKVEEMSTTLSRVETYSGKKKKWWQAWK